MTAYFVLLLIMTLLGSVASLFLKRASGSGGVMEMLTDTDLYIGAFLYLTASVLNIIVLRHLDYSIVLPLTSVTYIWTMLLSYRILKERIEKKKVIGVLLIIIGAVCVSL